MISPIKLPHTVAMILAGGRVGELSVLTLERPKSALPFAGHFRIIDFALSNCGRAGITQVGILSQYRPSSLIDHIGIGESWDFVGLDRGAKILPPYHAAEGSDWYRGNADAVLQNLGYLQGRGAELALILSGDHVYSMDYRDLILHHLQQEADLTIALKPVTEPDRRFGYATLDEGGRVVSYEEKPAEPRSNLASLTIYVFGIEPLTKVLTAMKDLDSIEFGRDVIPEMISHHRVSGYVFDEYWAYTRTIDSYYTAHQDLLAGRIDLERWMVRTNNEDNTLARRTPPIFRSWTEAEGSMISEGCTVEGKVGGSVLGPGVHVEREAVVENSILFQDVRVAKGAHVCQSILDKRSTVGEGATIGVAPRQARMTETAAGSTLGIALLGKDARIEPGAVVPRGGAIHPRAVVESQSSTGKGA